jgi:hypothetical protein
MPASCVARLLREALHCVLHPLSRLESFRFMLSLPAASSLDQSTLAGLLEATLQVCSVVVCGTGWLWVADVGAVVHCMNTWTCCAVVTQPACYVSALMARHLPPAVVNVCVCCCCYCYCYRIGTESGL